MHLFISGLHILAHYVFSPLWNAICLHSAFIYHGFSWKPSSELISSVELPLTDPFLAIPQTQNDLFPSNAILVAQFTKSSWYIYIFLVYLLKYVLLQLSQLGCRLLKVGYLVWSIFGISEFSLRRSNKKKRKILKS